jgi:hypothetical protein
MGSFATEGIRVQLNALKQAIEGSNKPCIIVCFGSRWTFDFLSDALSYSESNIKIPIMTRINQAIKAFKMVDEYNSTLNS